MYTDNSVMCKNIAKFNKTRSTKGICWKRIIIFSFTSKLYEYYSIICYFLTNFFIKSGLTWSIQALHDGYHKESHPVIISLITDIYIDLRPISTIPFETFANLLNMDYGKLQVRNKFIYQIFRIIFNFNFLQKFEVDLSQAPELKIRKNIVKKFLEGITGVIIL